MKLRPGAGGVLSQSPGQAPVRMVPMAWPGGKALPRAPRGTGVSGRAALPVRSCLRSNRRLATGRCGCPAEPPGPWGSRTPAAAAALPSPQLCQLPTERLVLCLTPPLIGRSASPLSHRFWFPLRERPKPACKGQACSFRDKRKSVPAPRACAVLSPAQRKGTANGPFGGPASQPLPAEEVKVGASVIAPWAWRGNCCGGGGGLIAEEGGWPAGGEGAWRQIFHSWTGRKGQRVGASLGSSVMSHQGTAVEGGEDMETSRAGGL